MLGNDEIASERTGAYWNLHEEGLEALCDVYDIQWSFLPYHSSLILFYVASSEIDSGKKPTRLTDNDNDVPMSQWGDQKNKTVYV